MPEVPEGFPKLDKQTRPWTCKKGDEACTRTKPCASCRGRRNRRKGAGGQAVGRKVLERISGTTAAFHGRKAHEETWSHLPVRVEAKAGAKGGANAVWNHYVKTRDQSDEAKAQGDARPFVAYFKPDGVSHGVFVIEDTQLEAVINDLGGAM